MLIEPVVFRGKDGLRHLLREVADAHHAAALFAELADQESVSRIDVHRHLGPVVREDCE
jgi:hypothetical protein